MRKSPFVLALLLGTIGVVFSQELSTTTSRVVGSDWTIEYKDIQSWGKERRKPLGNEVDIAFYTGTSSHNAPVSIDLMIFDDNLDTDIDLIKRVTEAMVRSVKWYSAGLKFLDLQMSDLSLPHYTIQTRENEMSSVFTSTYLRLNRALVIVTFSASSIETSERYFAHYRAFLESMVLTDRRP